MGQRWIAEHKRRALGQFSSMIMSESEGWPPSMLKAYEYALLGESKLLRPLLVYAACQSFGQTVALADVAACAVEWVHVYSLIFDDLPDLDDGEKRRGQPCFHKAFGGANAVLFGCALQAMAFYHIAHFDHYNPRQKVAMTKILSQAMGAEGMVGGQWLEFNELTRLMPSEHLVKQYHRRKTGAMIAASVMLGALAAGQEEPLPSAISQVGSALGWAFQMQDDLADFAEDGEHKQARLCNWAHLRGVDVAYQDFLHQCALAKEAARSLPEPRAMTVLVDYVRSLGDVAKESALEAQEAFIER